MFYMHAFLKIYISKYTRTIYNLLSNNVHFLLVNIHAQYNINRNVKVGTKYIYINIQYIYYMYIYSYIVVYYTIHSHGIKSTVILYIYL